MGRVSAIVLPVMFFVACACGAARAHADPIRVTGHFGSFAAVGRVEFADAGGIELFAPDGTRLLGSSFEGVLHTIGLPNLSTIPARGELADFSSVLTVFEGGEPLFTPFGALATTSTLSFTASPTRVVCHDNVFRGVVCGGVAPFAFNANLMFVGSPIALDLIGGGTVKAEFFGESVLLDYEFDASPTPEPASVSLLTTGVLMGGAGILRRRRLDRALGQR